MTESRIVALIESARDVPAKESSCWLWTWRHGVQGALAAPEKHRLKSRAFSVFSLVGDRLVIVYATGRVEMVLQEKFDEAVVLAEGDVRCVY
jgi:hypothetical protein